MRMARITRAASHLPVEEVKARMKNDPRPWCRNRWLIIYNALVDPREATDIAKHTGVTVSTVHTVIADSNRLGVAAVETPGKGGWRSGYLTSEEERDFLQPFFDRAAKGEIATAAQIKQEFEQRIGHEVHKTTIYRLLDRHQWRKLVPRPYNPKANKEKKSNFNKIFLNLLKEEVNQGTPKDDRPSLQLTQMKPC